MQDKIKITFEDVKYLHQKAIENHTLEAWGELALMWMKLANDEITRLNNILNEDRR